MTSLMTVIFTLFGIWIVSASFQQLLYRELDQAGVESRMFQYVFEMAYQSTPEEYGDAYALERACESAINNLAGEENTYFVLDESYQMVYGDTYAFYEPIFQEITNISMQLEAEKNYGSVVFPQDKSYYLLSACRSVNNDVVLYLAMCKDITSIY